MLEPAPYPPVETTICEADDLFIKQIVVPQTATILPQHSHQLSHVTLVIAGSVNLWRGDNTIEEHYAAPAMVRIAAGMKHLFQTLEPHTVLYCVHGLGSPEALKVLEEHSVL